MLIHIHFRGVKTNCRNQHGTTLSDKYGDSGASNVSACYFGYVFILIHPAHIGRSGGEEVARRKDKNTKNVYFALAGGFLISQRNGTAAGATGPRGGPVAPVLPA